MIVEVRVVSASSVVVSWDHPQASVYTLHGYVIYYSRTENGERQSEEESMAVPSSVNSTTIEGLMTNMVYQFQVVISVVVNGEVFLGDRSDAAVVRISELEVPATDDTASTLSRSLTSIIGGVVGFIVLAAIVSVVMVYQIRRHRMYVSV
jgi:hypothetical protein